MEKLEKIRQKFPGFIVNIHDVANLDIDIELPPEILERYDGVIRKSYQYVEYCDDEILTTGFSEPRLGRALRCHLKGVGVNKNLSKERDFNRSMNLIKYEIEHLLNQNNWMVNCHVFDIDIYSRLLVDVYIKKDEGNLSLKDFLLTHPINEELTLFYSYPR